VRLTNCVEPFILTGKPSVLLTIIVQRRLGVEKLHYRGWSNCYRLSNSLVDLVVTTDVGPRIIRFGFTGEENEFHEYPDMLGKTGGNKWRNYGGHRLWHAPEAEPRTYFPDNWPVKLEPHNSFVRLLQPTETTTGVQKEMDIWLSADKAHVRVTHRLRNANLWAVEFAPWALSVMAPGGTAVIPLPPRGTHPQFLLPTSAIVLWAYTNLSDPRWILTEKYIMLCQDSRAKTPQKAGVVAADGWAAYARNGHLFLVRFNLVPGARYPDMGSCVEVWTDPDMLEVETLGPLTRLEPGAVVEHVEDWFLLRDMPVPRSETDVDQHILPHIKTALSIS